MDKNYVLENEYDVNRVMLKIFKIMIGVLPITWLFKLINLFIVPWNVIITVSITILILSGLPIIVFKDYKNTKIKIYSVAFFLIFSTLVYSTVFVNGIFFMMIPSLIALIYFDIRLLKISFFSTLPYNGFWRDIGFFYWSRVYSIYKMDTSAYCSIFNTVFLDFYIVIKFSKKSKKYA